MFRAAEADVAPLGVLGVLGVDDANTAAFLACFVRGRDEPLSLSLRVSARSASTPSASRPKAGRPATADVPSGRERAEPEATMLFELDLSVDILEFNGGSVQKHLRRREGDTCSSFGFEFCFRTCSLCSYANAITPHLHLRPL